MTLDSVLDQINKKYGKGTVTLLSDTPKLDIEVTSTGSLALDLAVGVGGFPKGRIIEIYGPESSGKTTLAIHAMVECQKEVLDRAVLFIDVEHAFDKTYAEALGLDLKRVVVSQPSSGEEALGIASVAAESGAFSMIVLDSVAALVPKAELDGEIGESKVGLTARLMGQTLRVVTAKLSNSNTTMIFINQLREKVGVLFGSPETTTGGNALKFYATIRIDVRRGAAVKNKEGEREGSELKFKVVKNKVAPPFQEAVSSVYFGEGISLEGEIAEIGPLYGVVQKSGAWYSTKDGAKIAQGKAEMIQFLKDNPDFTQVLKREIIEAAFGL